MLMLDDLDSTASGLQQLYDNLGKTGARTTMLLLEVNFAKNFDELINPPNLPELNVEAMPWNAHPRACRAESLRPRPARHSGPRIWHRALHPLCPSKVSPGRPTRPRIGNDDKRIDTVELYVYTADMVRQAARKSFGLEQKPMLSKIDNLVVGQPCREFIWRDPRAGPTCPCRRQPASVSVRLS